MYLCNKSKTQIVNLTHVTALYIGGDDCTIKASFASSTGCQIARYNSSDEAVIAMEMLGKAIGKEEIFFMPTDEQVRMLLNANAAAERYHGKKVKRHGGS